MGTGIVSRPPTRDCSGSGSIYVVLDARDGLLLLSGTAETQPVLWLARSVSSRTQETMTLLYLDVDRPRPPKAILQRITQCCRLWRWPVEAVRFDRTRRGWHVVVAVAGDMDPALMVAAQAIMGSDLNREMFNVMRVQQLHAMPNFWRTRWNVLYVNHERGVKIANT